MIEESVIGGVKCSDETCGVCETKEMMNLMRKEEWFMKG